MNNFILYIDIDLKKLLSPPQKATVSKTEKAVVALHGMRVDFFPIGTYEGVNQKQ